MKGDPLARPPVPVGYAVRFATSHHAGGWKPCGGPADCAECRDNRMREARRVRQAAEAGPGEPSAVVQALAAATGGPA